MKIPTTIVAIAALPLTLSAQVASPSIPTGELTLDHNLVAEGVPPVIDWTITHPATIDEVVEVDPETETVTPKVDVKVKVSVIGVGISNGQGFWAPATTYLRFGSQWEHVYTGAGPDVTPNVIELEREVTAGTTISFASRYQNPSTGYQSPWYFNGSQNVAVLKNGDTPPSFAAGYADQASAEDYMRPYLAEDGTIQLGPRDLIYAAELTHTNTNSTGFDMQDSVIIVTFEETED